MRVPAYIIAAKNARADAFAAAGLPEVAQKLHDCTETKHLMFCAKCEETWYVTTQCRQRTCPVCAFHVARDRGDWLVAMTKKMAYPKKMELTLPPGDEPPRERIALLRDKFNKLRKTTLLRKVKGGAYQIELKWNEDHWHIHAHIIFDGPYIDQDALSREWGKLFGVEKLVTWIRACPGESELRYAVKYACKVSTAEFSGALIVAWYEAVKGSRLFTTFGTFYNWEIQEQDDEPDQEKPHSKCPCCGECGGVIPAACAKWTVDREMSELYEQMIYKGQPDKIDNDELEVFIPVPKPADETPAPL